MSVPVSPEEYGSGLDDEGLRAAGWSTGLDVWGPVSKAYGWYLDGGSAPDHLRNSQLWSLRQAIRAEFEQETRLVVEAAAAWLDSIDMTSTPAEADLAGALALVSVQKRRRWAAAWRSAQDSSVRPPGAAQDGPESSGGTSGHPRPDDTALDCGECYDIAHDEIDERETCDDHCPCLTTHSPAGATDLSHLDALTRTAASTVPVDPSWDHDDRRPYRDDDE